MTRPIFISYVFEDDRWLRQLQDWAAKGLLGPDFFVDAFDEKLPPTPDGHIKSRIKERIRKSAAVVVLVGDNTHNHKWIEDEVKMANSEPKRPIFVVRIPNTTGAPPDILKRYEVIPHSSVALSKALSKV